MKRIGIVALVALLALAPLQARATRLTRIIVHNASGRCMRVGVQEQGPNKARQFGPFWNNSSLDHTFAVGGDLTPNYFIEITLVDCGSDKVLFRDVHITQHESIVALKVVPRGNSFQITRWP